MRNRLHSVLPFGLGDRRGSTTVEFALVIMPFLLLLLGMLETGVVAFKSAVMEGATREAARQVRTGVVQTAADAATRFRTEFCPALAGLFPCAEFYFDVRTFADFNAIVLPAITYDAAGVPTNAVFAPGGANSVISVRVIHVHHFMTPLLDNLMGGAAGTVPLLSTAVMRTEPFE
jgi:Flp pilus assembly protein TadG